MSPSLSSSSLRQLLDEFPGRPDAPAVYWRDDMWSIADLEARAADLASRLRSLGVKPGHAVGVSLADSAEVVAALFGVWEAGAVYVPINPRLSDTEARRIVGQIRPAVIITHDGLELADDNPSESELDIALIQFTSGTTGTPKPVLLRHSGVLELLDGVLGTLRKPSTGAPARTPMPNLIPVSLSLWAGIYQVLFAYRVGAAVIILGGFETKRFAEAVHRFGIKSTVLPPAAMTMLSDDDDIDNLAPLKYVRSITAPLSPLQARRFHDRFGISVMNCYGQTEIGGEIVGWSADDTKAFGETKLGAVGRPHRGVTVRVEEATGELLVRTPALAAGYAGGQDMSDRMTDDGWFRTGDIASIDDEGFIWIEGRVSDMINRGGLKVFPAEVAEVLRLSPDVADTAVVGVPDDRLGEVPAAFVVLQPGARLDPASLAALCREHLAPYKVPVRFESIDELPRNEIGKVLNRMLIERVTGKS